MGKIYEKEKLVKIGIISLIFGVMYLFPPTYKKVVGLEAKIEDFEEQVGLIYYEETRNLELNTKELLKIDYTKDLSEEEIIEVDLLVQEQSSSSNVLFYSNNQKIVLTEW